MNDTEPTTLSDAELLALSVIWEHRRQRRAAGVKILLLPFVPCPTCGATVDEVVIGPQAQATFLQAVTMQPCGHRHTVSEDALLRLQEHVGEMLTDIEDADRRGEGANVEAIVREAHDRTTPDNFPTSEDAADNHVCKPNATTYYCPTVGETESDCHGGFDVCCARPELHQPISLRARYAAAIQAVQDGQAAPVEVSDERIVDAVMAVHSCRPERLPADVLALFPPSLQPAYRSYLSDACRTARLIDGLIINHPGRDDLPGRREQLHQDCAGADPYTGTLCDCACHPASP